MKHFEFKEIINAFESVSLEGHTQNKKEYKFDICPHITFYYDNKNEQVVILGRIPYKIIQNILIQYPNFKNMLYIGTKNHDWESMIRLLGTFDIKDNYGYLNAKHFPNLIVDSRDALVILMYHIHRYYYERSSKSFDEYMTCEEKLHYVNSRLLQLVNHNDLFKKNAPIHNVNEHSELNDALIKFDNAANPFANMETSKTSEIIGRNNIKVTFNAYGNTPHEHYNGISITIKDTITNNVATYFKGEGKLIYQIEYNIGEVQTVVVSHYFASFMENPYYNGELVGIFVMGSKDDESLNRIYNLSKNKLIFDNNEIKTVTETEISELITFITNATEEALNIIAPDKTSNSLKRYI